MINRQIINRILGGIMYRMFVKNKKLLSRFFALLMACMSLVTLSSNAFAFSKVVYANADPWKYFVELDLTNKITTVYEKDSKGKYSKIAKQFISTTGLDETPTPEGSFIMNDSRRRFGYFTKFDVYAQYWSNVAGGIYFHSIIYTKPEEGAWTTSSYRALGKQASHGCIRMLVEDARWIYYNCPAGTRGVIVSNPKNEALRQSLLPKQAAKDYKPTADEYEAANRGLARAKVVRETTFTPVSGSDETVDRGTLVQIISSGGKTCRVKVGDREGHILTRDLEFFPNGPKDKQISLNQKEIAQVSSKQAPVYKASTTESAVIGTYGKGTTLKIKAETASFYQVSVDGKIGFIKKTDVSEGYVSLSYKDVVKRIDTSPAPSATAAPTVAPTASPDETATTTKKPLSSQHASFDGINDLYEDEIDFS